MSPRTDDTLHVTDEGLAWIGRQLTWEATLSGLRRPPAPTSIEADARPAPVRLDQAA